MKDIGTTVKDMGVNRNLGFQQLMQRNQQGMAALLTRIQGTDARVAMIGHAVSGIPGASFVMPTPTAAAVTGYGGSGGAIANEAGADAETNGVPSEGAETVTKTALVAATPLADPHLGDAHYRQVDPRLVGAPFPAAKAAAPGGAATHIGAPMSPEHSGGLDGDELPARTEAATETRFQRLKRIALFSARLLAVPSASDVAGETMGTLTTTDGRRSARLASTMTTSDGDGTVVGGGTTQTRTAANVCAELMVPDRLVRAAQPSLLSLVDPEVPGPPKLRGNAHRCGLQAHSQTNGFDYCCGSCFQTYAVQHDESCRYWHTPDSSAVTEMPLNDTLASDEAGGMKGTVCTTTDERRSARLASTMKTVDNDGTVVDGGMTQGSGGWRV